MIHNNSHLPMARYIKKSTFKDYFMTFVSTSVVIGMWSYCTYLANQLSYYL